MQINDIFTKEQYTQYAKWANKNNAQIIKLEDGKYQVVAIPEPPEPTIEEQNEAIRQTRQQLFTEQADPLKYDYEECLARYGETDERTIEAKNTWLAMKDEIRDNNPYVAEPAETATSEVLDDSEIITESEVENG